MKNHNSPNITALSSYEIDTVSGGIALGTTATIIVTSCAYMAISIGVVPTLAATATILATGAAAFGGDYCEFHDHAKAWQSAKVKINTLFLLADIAITAYKTFGWNLRDVKDFLK